MTTRRAGGERGSVSVFLLPVAVAVLAGLGLVTDGGAVLAARVRALDLAAACARAGAQAVDVAALRAPGDTLRVDGAAARKAVLTYQTAAAVPAGTCLVATTATDTVAVTVRVRARFGVLALAGLSGIEVTETATARVVRGVVAGGDV